MAKRVEQAIRLGAKVLIWNGRLQKTREVVQTVQSHRQTFREARQAVGWWARLVLPRDDD